MHENAEIDKQGKWTRVDRVKVHKRDALRGFVRLKCPDCDGTGIFLGPQDEPWTCVACKGTGKIWANC